MGYNPPPRAISKPPPPPKGQSGQSSMSTIWPGLSATSMGIEILSRCYGMKYVKCLNCGAEKLNGCMCDYCQTYGSDDIDKIYKQTYSDSTKIPPPPTPPKNRLMYG